MFIQSSQSFSRSAVLKVVSDFLLAADRGEVTLLSLLDMSAAFDTVDHDILIQRLHHSFGLRDEVLSSIKSFITVRTQRVRAGGTYSMYSAVYYGVPQGSVLGPILFLLYTADVLVIAARHDVGVHSYADDTQLSTSPDNSKATFVRLTSCINEIGRFPCSRAGMGESPFSELRPYPRLNIVCNVSRAQSVGRDVCAANVLATLHKRHAVKILYVRYVSTFQTLHFISSMW